MARLFVGPKEIQFINDLTKEYIKDIVGQKIYYYSVAATKTNTHMVYDEALNKVFNAPVELNAIVAQDTWETKHNAFGAEQTTTIEVFVQSRELLDKNMKLFEGDFFTYAEKPFEIVSYLEQNNVFGQEEYAVNFKIIGKLARAGQFNPNKYLGPTEDGPEAQVSVFTQQRGLKENRDGPTGDVRQVRDRLKKEQLEMAPIALGEGPRMVEPQNGEDTSSFNTESLPPPKGFYDE